MLPSLASLPSLPSLASFGSFSNLQQLGKCNCLKLYEHKYAHNPLLTPTQIILLTALSSAGFGSSPFMSADGTNVFPFNPELLPDAHTASLLLGRKRKVGPLHSYY
jgi:hypothetical protein